MTLRRVFNPLLLFALLFQSSPPVFLSLFLSC